MRGGAGVLPRLFFFNSRPQNRGAAPVLGVGGGCLRNLSAALSLRSVRRRSAVGALGYAQLFGRGVFAALVFFNSRPQNRGAAQRRFWAARRFAQSFGGALAPLSSPPFRRRGAWMCPTIRARGFCRACFF